MSEMAKKQLISEKSMIFLKKDKFLTLNGRSFSFRHFLAQKLDFRKVQNVFVLKDTNKQFDNCPR